ncbi:hypothetical protein HAPAU_32720 [Halalkalicoccus paucihalophilus]|uniref:Uncharacterized protein n=1 Tax=Halalkalicoccus paucihalophilus TaxID=1008153 RepID=A0A151A9J9_9EURY|nr:hypothetical protein HAPAU_32720 [Halalkalicoccus paucihalophilus]
MDPFLFSNSIHSLTSSHALKGVESPAWGIQPATGEVSAPFPERRLCGFRTQLGAGCGTAKGAPILRRVIAFRFPRNALPPRVYAASDVRRRCQKPTASGCPPERGSGDCVDVRLVLRNPTLWVRASERRLRPTPSDVSALVARLGRICQVGEPNRDTGIKRLVLGPAREARKSPFVKASVHPLSVVAMFTMCDKSLRAITGKSNCRPLARELSACFFSNECTDGETPPQIL